MHMMRRLMILSLSQNIHFQTEHLPGISNTAADLISRLQVLISTHEQRTYSGSISHQDLHQTADVLVHSSLSKSTASAYKSVFLTYTRFVTQYFGTASHPLLPLLQHSGFIDHCFLKGLAACSNPYLYFLA